MHFPSTNALALQIQNLNYKTTMKKSLNDSYKFFFKSQKSKNSSNSTSSLNYAQALSSTLILLHMYLQG